MYHAGRLLSGAQQIGRSLPAPTSKGIEAPLSFLGGLLGKVFVARRSGACAAQGVEAGGAEDQGTNGPTETMNGLAKRIKRVAFGMTNFVHWRIRVLLYAGKPDWARLSLVTP